MHGTFLKTCFATVAIVVVGAWGLSHVRAARAEAAAQAGAWEYKMRQHDVSLMLPSAQWRASSQSPDLAGFWTATSDLDILFGVTGVDAMLSTEFESSISKLQQFIAGRSTVVGKPLTERGTTPNGDPYMTIFYEEKLPQGLIPGAMSRVWLRAPAFTVALRFEAHPKQQNASRGLKDAVRFITKSVKYAGVANGPAKAAPVLDSSASAVKGTSTAAPATGGGTEPLPPGGFRFDWGSWCRVPVTETVEKKDSSSRLGYVVSVVQRPDKSFEVRLEDFSMSMLNGKDVTSPEWQARLKPALALTSAIPAMRLSPKGEFIDCESFDRLIDRMLNSHIFPPERAGDMRKVLAVPSMQAAMQDAVQQYWFGWVEAWIGWPLRPGASTKAHITRTLPNKRRLPVDVQWRFVAYRDGYATLEEIDTATGPGPTRAMLDPLMHDVARSIGKPDVPTNLIKDARIDVTFTAETRADNLRPRRTRSNRQFYVKLADGTESRGAEIHDLEWDWAHAEGCRAAH